MATVDLGNGMSIKLRDNLSMGDAEKINAGGKFFDARFNQWRTDEFAALITMIEVVVEEWTIDPPEPPTAEGFRKLPIKLGNKIGPAVTDHIKALGLTDEDLDEENGT